MFNKFSEGELAIFRVFRVSHPISGFSGPSQLISGFSGFSGLCRHPDLLRGVNYSFERRTGFGIFLDFSLILLDFWGFFGIFVHFLGFFPEVYGIFSK